MKLQFTLIALKLASLLLFFDILPAYPTASVLSSTQQINTLSTSVEQWKDQISKQQGFEIWKKSTTKVQSLGPGTHGWIVLVKNGSEVVGYMIVHATEEGGYILNEYGVGELPLIDTYSESIAYFGPFHTIVKLDAETFIEPYLQEQFPITEKDIKQYTKTNRADIEKGHGSLKQPALITNTFSTAYFSPYYVMPWLTGEPVLEPLNDQLIDDYSIETNIELGSQLRYTTEIWNQAVFSSYSITSYHKWNEQELFLGLQSDNELVIRYLAYDSLLEQGYFYEPTAY